MFAATRVMPAGVYITVICLYSNLKYRYIDTYKYVIIISFIYAKWVVAVSKTNVPKRIIKCIRAKRKAQRSKSVSFFPIVSIRGGTIKTVNSKVHLDKKWLYFLSTNSWSGRHDWGAFILFFRVWYFPTPNVQYAWRYCVSLGIFFFLIWLNKEKISMHSNENTFFAIFFVIFVTAIFSILRCFELQTRNQGSRFCRCRKLFTQS